MALGKAENCWRCYFWVVVAVVSVSLSLLALGKAENCWRCWLDSSVLLALGKAENCWRCWSDLSVLEGPKHGLKLLILFRHHRWSDLFVSLPPLLLLVRLPVPLLPPLSLLPLLIRCHFPLSSLELYTVAGFSLCLLLGYWRWAS